MISIIITSYKEPKTIGRAIESFQNQKINEKYEIIVVAPDKETLDVSKKYKVNCLKDPGKGKPTALNLAFSKAKGDILFLTDGDVYVSNNSVNEMLRLFKDKSTGAVTGRPISLNLRNNMFGYWSHLLTDEGAHETRLALVKENKFIVCSGYLYAFRKKLIDKIAEDALSEDAVISHLIWGKGYKIVYAPKAEVYIKYPNNFKDWIKQKRRSAGGYQQIKNYVKNPKRMRSFWKETTGWYRALKYAKNLKELYWTFLLFGARLYLWFRIFLDIDIRKKEFGDIWKRVESTK